MKSSVEADTVWEDIKPFVDNLIAECRMKRYSAQENGGDPVVRYSYADLRQATGHDFKSDGQGRDALYANRDRLAWDDHLFFDSIHGRGMRFTTDPAIGVKWYCDLADKVCRAYLKRRRELAKAAHHHTPEKKKHLREAMAAVAEQTERDHATFIRKAREIRHVYDDLQREGDLPRLSEPEDIEAGHDLPDDMEALDCKSCGETWVREIKRGQKPSTCPDCK